MPAQTPKSIPFGQLAPSEWPGERLGLPVSGRGSVGRAGRRIAALSIDWALAYAVSALLFRNDDPAMMNLTITLCFAVMQCLFMPTIGGSIGHRLLGLRLVPLAGGWVGLWRPVVRSVLLCLVIPALVWDSDQRGFHDKVAGTVLIRG